MSVRSVNVTEVIENSRFSSIQKRVVLLCLALGISDGLNSLSVGYAIPSLAEQWQVAPGAFSAVIVAAVVGEIIASVTLAPLADRFGRKAMVAVGITLFGLSTLVAAVAPTVLMLVACRFVAGLGIGTASPNLFALGSEFAPAKYKATVVTVIGTGMALGGAICGVIAGFVVPAFGGHAIFILAGAIPLLVLMTVAAFLPDSLEMYADRGNSEKIASILNMVDGCDTYSPDDDYSSRTGQNVGRHNVVELFRQGRLVSTAMVWAMLLLSITGSYFVFSWLTTLLVMSGIDEATAIFGTSITTFGGIAGGILLGIAMDRSRWGVTSLTAGVLIQVAATVVLVLVLGFDSAVPSPIVIGVCFMLGFGIIGTGTAMTAVVAQTYPPELRATGIGWAAGFSRIGAIVAPLVGGALIDSGLPATTVLAMSLIPALLNGVLIVLFKHFGKFAASAPAGQREQAEVAALTG